MEAELIRPPSTARWMFTEAACMGVARGSFTWTCTLKPVHMLARAADPVPKAWDMWNVKAVSGSMAMVRGVPPFPFVRESLQKLCPAADVLVVSATPQEALEREWREHKLDHLVNFIAGQEAGTKAEHIHLATRGRYGQERILMIGDAPGDLQAARDNAALFFPIVPGQEEHSWKRLYEQGSERFFAGTFAGSYQQELLVQFEAALPARPPWQG